VFEISNDNGSHDEANYKSGSVSTAVEEIDTRKHISEMYTMPSEVAGDQYYHEMPRAAPEPEVRGIAL
jgi:hypothetical protein